MANFHKAAGCEAKTECIVTLVPALIAARIAHFRFHKSMVGEAAFRSNGGSCSLCLYHTALDTAVMTMSSEETA